MNTTVHYLAPAKINLCLHVLGRRPDGYHELAMIMQRVSLYDRLEMTLTDEPGVRVSCPGVELPPDEENIAARAARRLLSLKAAGCGVEIVIDKQIPVAAGLGGGSSDAAAVLMGLNDMLELGLSRNTLMEEGGRLGADVPFFVFGAAAWATGIGDVLEKVEDMPPLWYVLVNPGLAVSTAWVYQNLGLTSKIEAARLPRFPRTLEGVVGLLHNDLERVTVSRYPLVATVKEELVASGAAGVLMSGSGPTVFGVFAGEAVARMAADELRQSHSDWRVFVVQPV
jgi:4-diphosphocytidyl-2-C-methyl-D-erythritol kinase